LSRAGDLACGWQGEGRLAEPEVIAAKVFALLKLA
jgi:phosphopantothenoylcysteine synthetase/decarboxylase